MSKLTLTETVTVQQVREIVWQKLERAQLPPDFLKLVEQALQQEAHLLAPDGLAKTVRRLIGSCNRLGCPNPGEVAKAAAAVELMFTALDVLDDIQDGLLFVPNERRATGQWINVALYLIFQAQQLLDELNYDSRELRRVFNSQILKAINAQFLDLAHEQTDELTSEAALEIVRNKSGALGRGLFEIAGHLAGLSKEALVILGKIGEGRTVISQLQNDLSSLAHDWRNPTARECSDLALRKKTVPIVFALNYARKYASPNALFLLEYFVRPLAQQQPPTAEQYAHLREIVLGCGTVSYVELLVEMIRGQNVLLVDELVALGYPEFNDLVSVLG
jgi:geranylgeranyl pyrophosphate synthase